MPIDYNYRWLSDYIKTLKTTDYKARRSKREIEDSIVVLLGNYILSFGALVKGWESFQNNREFFNNDSLVKQKIEEALSILNAPESHFQIVMALRNFIAHRKGLPIRIGQGIDVNTGDFIVRPWVIRDDLLRDLGRNDADKQAIRLLPPVFDLLPIIDSSRIELETLHVHLFKLVLTTKRMIAVKDGVRSLQKDIGLEEYEFTLLQSSPEIDEEEGKLSLPKKITLNLIEIRWGIIQYIEQLQNYSNSVHQD